MFSLNQWLQTWGLNVLYAHIYFCDYVRNLVKSQPANIVWNPRSVLTETADEFVFNFSVLVYLIR